VEIHDALATARHGEVAVTGVAVTGVAAVAMHGGVAADVVEESAHVEGVVKVAVALAA